MKEYGIDKLGYFNQAEFDNSGRKFRPIDIHYSRLITVNPELVKMRERRRNGETNGQIKSQDGRHTKYTL